MKEEDRARMYRDLRWGMERARWSLNQVMALARAKAKYPIFDYKDAVRTVGPLS